MSSKATSYTSGADYVLVLEPGVTHFVRLLNYREVIPIREGNYPSLDAIWKNDEDDEAFAEDPS